LALSKDTIKQYKTLAHDLKPVVMIANKGLHEGVLNEIQRALNDHELIKVKIAIPDKESRKNIIQEILDQSNSELIQEIGKVAVFYRESKKKSK
jgi:RNA-binding protein